ncbi:hypothetical protein RHMOL_Rhmol07G0059900 [Rhododendron molle]|uniref:Uncharacterized protein n=1 Tax=Rhododendron molle TaxID=49168 RepID=A0ACC0MYY7_RHOML|nr:hypothetical protein RHMOL_Rhmol07G0059900 [Rhododendron molle]
MAEQGEAAPPPPPPDAQLFGLLSSLLQQVEALTNQEEVELRAKIEALGLEVTKVPSNPTQNLDELEIANELDKLSAKLDDVDEMISSAMAADPQVKSLLSSTADVWLPVITATSDERRTFTASNADDNAEAKGNISDYVARIILDLSSYSDITPTLLLGAVRFDEFVTAFKELQQCLRYLEGDTIEIGGELSGHGCFVGRCDKMYFQLPEATGGGVGADSKQGFSAFKEFAAKEAKRLRGS